MSTCPRDAETLQTEFPFLANQRPIENTERDKTIAGEQPEKQMASFMQNNLQNKSDQRTNDTPGMVGIIGTALGKHGCNIANMSLARMDGGNALSIYELDAVPMPEVVKELGGLAKIDAVKVVDLS